MGSGDFKYDPNHGTRFFLGISVCFDKYFRSADEAGLRRLSAQLKAGKVAVKLFVQYPLHAKLYLCFRPHPINPNVGYPGSSNLTLAGLSGQGELNVDVLDHDAAMKLYRWFEDRWTDQWCAPSQKDVSRLLTKVGHAY